MTHFSQQLLSWYKSNKRIFPWREHIHVYHTWICEIMSQQTTLAVVLPRFSNFISELPTVQHLARCDDEKLRELWAGLGYYARARNLKKGAQYIVETYGTHFPTSKEEWLKVPGCGDYTSSIIASICFQETTPSIDGNVIRVASRLLSLKNEAWEKKGQAKIACYVKSLMFENREQCVPAFSPGDFNQAMMDLGATICKKQNPLCHVCPVNNFCSAYKNNIVSLCPSKKPRKEFLDQEILALAFSRKLNSEVILMQRTSGFLSKTKGFPILKMDNNFSRENIFRQIKSLGLKIEFFENAFQHTITHHKINAHTLFLQNVQDENTVKRILNIFALDANERSWTPYAQLKQNISSSLDQKVLKTLSLKETLIH